MAMSSLAAQLAGLNSAGKKNQTVGSVLPASTRHEDAIGRGFHHSVQVGHSLPGRLDPRMVPSLLYSDAKAASDISLAILWENCEAALTELAASMDYPALQQYVGICQDALLRQKRKTSSSSNNLSLTQLLTILSTLLPHDPTNCGHILEYLVRRYNIHVAAADTLLMTLLPHCDTPSLKSMFHRALELVNIMGAIQTQHTWIWLRPYAQPLNGNDGDGTTTTSIKVPPRHVVAQQVVAPHTALLQQVCNFTQSVARLEGNHRGKAQILSWSATVLVQGLHHLQTRQTLPQTQESVLRVLLPVCTKACSSFDVNTTRDWTVWGHVVASVIAETMELAPSVQQLVCQSIVAGAVKAVADDNNDDSSDAKVIVGDALVAVASVCFPLNTTIPDPWNATLKTWKECVLLPFPAVLETIWSGNNSKLGDVMPNVLEHLLTERKLDRMGIVVVIPLLIWAVLHPSSSVVSQERLVALLRNNAVRQVVWKKHTECLAEWLVWVYVQDMEEDDNDDNTNNQKEKQGEMVQAILKELRKMDAKACEQGMAQALQEVAMDSDCQATLKVLLDSVLPPVAGGTGDSNSDTASSTAASWLPPRVALEHSEPALRLQAIKQLLHEYVAESEEEDAMDVDNDEDGDDDDDDDATESLQTALGRRLASDDNPKVVLAAAKALQTILTKNSKSDKQRGNVEDNALRALYQWTSFQKPGAPTPSKKEKKHKKKKKEQKEDEKAVPEIVSDETQQSIIIHCLQLLGASSDSSPSSLVLEALVAHLEHWNSTVVAAAAGAITRVLGEEKATTDAKRLLLLERHEFCASLILEQSEKSGLDEMAQHNLRRRSLWVLLDAMKEYVSDPSTSVVVTEVSQMAVDACLFLLSSKTEKKTGGSDNDRAQKVQDAWKICTSHIAATEVARLLVSLASLSDSNTLRDPLISELAENVKDTNGHVVSVFSVLLEAALQETASPKAIKRLLSTVESKLQENKKSDSAIELCVVPALALLENTDKAVRDQSLELLSTLNSRLGSSKKWKPVAAICEEVLKKRSSAALGGISFLPLSFAAAVRRSGDALRGCMLSLSFCSAVACGNDSVAATEETAKNAWLPFGHANGQIGAVATILHAMELAGEEAFPLELRWDRFGAPMLKLLLADKKEEVSASALVLCDSVISMMKGIAVADTRSLDAVVISSGPGSSGRRQRSYSVGKADGVTFVDPYPAAMVAAIVDVLVAARKGKTAAAQELCKMLAAKVLGRESWATAVFKKIASEDKRKIATEILSILAESELHISVDFFLALPLDSADVTVLQSDCAKNQDDLSAMSLLADYIRANNDQLLSSPDATKLITTLFESLTSLSSTRKGGGGDGVEFVRQVTLSALVDLFSSSATAGHSVKIADKKVKGFVDLLLALNSNDAAPRDVRPLVSQRAKTVSLALLMSLCSSFPKPVVSSLIPALTTQIEAVQNIEEDDSVGEGLYSSFASIVPVFWQYSSHAGLSFSDLLCAFVTTARSISSLKTKETVYASFLRSIVESSLSGQSEPSVGAIATFYFAGEELADGDKFKKNMQASTAFALQLSAEAPAVAQVSSMTLLLNYADSLLVRLQSTNDAEVTASNTSFDYAKSQLPKANEILNMALFGSKSAPNKGRPKKTSKKEKGTIMNLVQAILLTVNDAMLLGSVRKFIRRSERSNTALCLRLWQDMLIVQSTVSGTASALSDGDDVYWESLIRITGETLEHIQGLMPLPIFLASATSLIKDGGTDDLRAGAIRLVADRAPEVRPSSPEASLFLEMASLLVEFVNPPANVSNEDKTGQFQLQQAALVAIEHIARAVGNNTARQKKRSTSADGTQTFLSALQGCADLFVKICGPGKDLKVDIGQLDDESRKLLSSAALCTATLVRVTAPKCLALLPKFMNQLVSCLSSVNQFMSSIGNDQQETLSEAKMIQVCVLRALTAVAESIPQFIYPYLKQMLSSSALPSEMLRISDADQTVLHAADGLEKCLSKHVPARVLLPVISSSMSNLKAPVEFEVLLRMLKESIDSSSGEELAGHLGSLLKAVTATYDFDCELNFRYALIDVANEAVLALVMKLSENHLRRLFASLRDWKGNLNPGNPEELALRRVAFWKVSAVLSKELRMIFLPCLSSVLPELLEELNLFVSQFCSPKKSEKSKDGTKKRRLEDDSTASFPTDAMLPLQPLLTCVEFALRADAADGGKWIRAGDDGERYRSVLAPLGKLLQSKLPDNFPLSASVGDDLASLFQEVVQGGDDAMGGSSTSNSSVIDCVTALASAAGNEQLWKPLNYAILDACGNRSRSEVRKAGLLCLLSVMKSLGEEYMVLLPECLPVLSELLEDNDEVVAGLAQDCISLGEELLGESLEDNLR